MKFKIASVVGLIVPLSIASMLTVFAGCGGGAYGANAAPYDGNWVFDVRGYNKPDAQYGGTVSCNNRYQLIAISHGSGSGVETIFCTESGGSLATPLTTLYYLSVGVTLTPDATGITGTANAIITGGGVASATCIDRLSCTAGNLTMYKCGTAAADTLAYTGPRCP